MRPKKVLPPPNQPKLQPAIEDVVDVPASIHTIEHVMLSGFRSEIPVTVGQLQDLCGMFVADLLFRKVTPEYWLKVQELPFRLHDLAARLKAEHDLLKVSGLPETVVATLTNSIFLSQKEINDLRGKLLAEVNVLKQCPFPGTSIH